MSQKEQTDEKEYETLFDLGADDTETPYRIYSVLSYIVVLIVIGLPVWWMTTRVYRADLPLSEMHRLELPKRLNKPYGIPLSVEYEILVTIVNPNPEKIHVKLDGQLIDINLQPFLNATLGPDRSTVKTQWLYLADLGIVPMRDGQTYYLREDQLPLAITPLEKKLWSHMSQSPCINLVLYLSDCSTPLHIRDKSNQRVESDSFFSSRWGGISILNPTSEACAKSLFEPDLAHVVGLFKKHLRKLLQINGNSDADLINFRRTRAREMIDSTRRTLKSLAQLLSEISSIVISDDVAEKIRIALENSELAEKHLQGGQLEEALKLAEIAFKNSEAAFSDPSLLALLYFPDDQKYAIYIPLFLPVMIPVLMSVTTLRHWWIARNKIVSNEKVKTQ